MAIAVYKVNIKQLSEPWFEKVMADTLDMYLEKGSLSDSPLTVKSREFAKVGLWHRDCDGVWIKDEKNYEECFRHREKATIELYHSIKDNGYNGSSIIVRFDDEGRIHIYDGFHRVAIMKYLGMDVDLNVQAGWEDNDWDFPLVDVLLKTDRKGKQTYQPVLDRRISKAGFSCDRMDSYSRLDYMLTHMVGDTVLDIGCSEGYFALELAKRGYRVTAIDADKNKAAVTRYLATINNVDVDCRCCWMEDLLVNSKHYDNVVFFSVFHNTLATGGLDKAYSGLRLLAGRTSRLFFEYPNTSEYYWRDHYREPPINGFLGGGFKQSIEDSTGMKILGEWAKYRPMMVLGVNGNIPNKRRLGCISDERWKEHSKWEEAWWFGCVNTLDEQLKQERIYVPYMKLDQFATDRMSFDLKGRSVLDIGGGPVSLLLRCRNRARAVVVDPCGYPEWVAIRYKEAGIEYVKEKAETVELSVEGKFDEVWIYNVLQHVQDPVKVVETAKRYGKKIRIFEPLEIGVHKGHPHNLTKDALDEAFGKEGLIDHVSDGQIYYFGVFNYE